MLITVTGKHNVSATAYIAAQVEFGRKKHNTNVGSGQMRAELHSTSCLTQSATEAERNVSFAGVWS